MHPTRSTVILGVALVASLAVNAIALWPDGEPVAQPAPSARRVPAAPRKHAEADPAATLRACEERLKARQAKDALRSLAAGLRASRDGASGKVRGKDDLDDLRCRIAEKQMRDRWREKKEETLANVRKSLADSEGQARNAIDDAERIAKSLDLSASETDRFTERFRPLRLETVGALSAALEKDPVDYTAAQDVMRRNFGEEIRLLAELFGDATAERYAADAEEGELTVLTMISAMGDLPLPDPLR